MGFQDNVNVDVRGAAHIAPCIYKTVVLKQNITKQNLNVLTQIMLDEYGANTKFVIKWDYVLKSDITIPANCVLEFDGGSISGGCLVFDNTKITGLPKMINVELSGTIFNSTLYVSWFATDTDITDALDILTSYVNQRGGKTICIDGGNYTVRHGFEIVSDSTIKSQGRVIIKLINNSPYLFHITSFNAKSYERYLFDGTDGGFCFEGPSTDNPIGTCLYIGDDVYYDTKGVYTKVIECLEIRHFEVGVVMTDQHLYIMSFNHVNIHLGYNAVRIVNVSGREGYPNNAGENIDFNDCVFGNMKDYAFDINSRFFINCIGCSFDYTNGLIKASTHFNLVINMGNIENVDGTYYEGDYDENKGIIYNSLQPTDMEKSRRVSTVSILNAVWVFNNFRPTTFNCKNVSLTVKGNNMLLISDDDSGKVREIKKALFWENTCGIFKDNINITTNSQPIMLPPKQEMTNWGSIGYYTNKDILCFENAVLRSTPEFTIAKDTFDGLECLKCTPDAIDKNIQISNINVLKFDSSKKYYFTVIAGCANAGVNLGQCYVNFHCFASDGTYISSPYTRLLNADGGTTLTIPAGKGGKLLQWDPAIINPGNSNIPSNTAYIVIGINLTAKSTSPIYIYDAYTWIDGEDVNKFILNEEPALSTKYTRMALYPARAGFGQIINI